MKENEELVSHEDVEFVPAEIKHQPDVIPNVVEHILGDKEYPADLLLDTSISYQTGEEVMEARKGVLTRIDQYFTDQKEIEGITKGEFQRVNLAFQVYLL